jgi:hypothetical protein
MATTFLLIHGHAVLFYDCIECMECAVSYFIFSLCLVAIDAEVCCNIALTTWRKLDHARTQQPFHLPPLSFLPSFRSSALDGATYLPTQSQLHIGLLLSDTVLFTLSFPVVGYTPLAYCDK